MKKWAWIAAVVALVTVGLVETVRAQDAPPLPPEPTVYLSELRWLRATNGWNGDPRNDASIEDNAIRIRGETYARGIGCHADAEIVYKIYPQFKRFVAVLGVDDEKDGAGTVTFTLLADDKVLFESGKVTAKMPRICVNLELPEGAKELIIKVGDAGDGVGCDHADLANAGFLTDGKPFIIPVEPPSEEFAVLFDGEVLDPWTADSDAWGVRNGTIQCQSSSGGTYLVLKQANSASFELRLKYRLAGGRAAVVYRGARSGPHVDGYRAVLEDTVGVAGLVTANGRTLAGLGELTEVDAQGEPTVVGRVADARALRAGGYAKTGAWNDLLIAVRGDYLIQELNGNTTVRVIDRSTKAPKGDLLALHVSGEGSPAVEFKGIFLRRIDTQYGDAFRIFNGKDYSGWTYSSDRLKNTWSVLDGVMHNAGKPGGYIRTEKDYTSYHISLQIRHLTSGNSGVLLRMVGEDKVWPRSIECQGMYGNLGDIWNIDKFPMQADPGRTNGRHTRKMHGSNMRPVGEWNNYDILLAGPRLEIRVNGLLQNAADECWITPGKICLQSEGAVTQFANIVLVPVIGADR